jgi:hypothetical protein
MHSQINDSIIINDWTVFGYRLNMGMKYVKESKLQKYSLSPV